MKTKGELKFTGLLIILGVISYLLFIGNTTKQFQKNIEANKIQMVKTQIPDSTNKNPFSSIYQKISLEKNKEQNALLNHR